MTTPRPKPRFGGCFVFVAEDKRWFVFEDIETGSVYHLRSFTDEMSHIRPSDVPRLPTNEVDWAAIEAGKGPWSRALQFEKPGLMPGEFHPRIHRGAWQSRLDSNDAESRNSRDIWLELPSHEVAYSAWQVAYAGLASLLAEVLETVEPDTRNLETFGSRLRRLLIFTCTEIEASWTGILKANGYLAPCGTQDYVKLATPMRLNEWTVRLQFFGGRSSSIPPLCPLKSWPPAPGIGTTAALPWYKAYNKTKHDREENLDKATLHEVLNAFAALFVLGVGQFGPWDQSGINPLVRFEIVSRPSWSIGETYFPWPWGPTPKLLFP